MRPDGTFIIPMHHPRALFANQTYAFAMLSDWEKAVRIQRDGPTRIPPHVEEWQWKPSLHDVVTWFGHTQGKGHRMQLDPGPWSVDFEGTVDGRPVCVGFWSCDDPMRRRGLCVPVLGQGGVDYWTPDEWRVVLGLLGDFFTDPRRGKIGHNLVVYDTGLLELAYENGAPFIVKHNARSLLKTAWGIDIQGVVGDTMAAHHLLFSELRMNLAFCASLTTDLPPFKLEVWEGGDDGDEETSAKSDWIHLLDRPDIKTRTYNLMDNFAQAVTWNEEVRMMA